MTTFCYFVIWWLCATIISCCVYLLLCQPFVDWLYLLIWWLLLLVDNEYLPLYLCLILKCDFSSNEIGLFSRAVVFHCNDSNSCLFQLCMICLCCSLSFFYRFQVVYGMTWLIPTHSHFEILFFLTVASDLVEYQHQNVFSWFCYCFCIVFL